jgi:catechol 2,3-dioxygenase-like lactoylglutathione lyase family enzyme
VLNLEKSRQFYVDVLGFAIVPRPPFKSPGYWLHGYGLALHLIVTEVPDERREVKLARIQHFSSALPRVDHIAFVTSDINYVQSTLDEAKVYYKADNPAGKIKQIFLFDPDGNVIEITNGEVDEFEESESISSFSGPLELSDKIDEIVDSFLESPTTTTPPSESIRSSVCGDSLPSFSGIREEDDSSDDDGSMCHDTLYDCQP